MPVRPVLVQGGVIVVIIVEIIVVIVIASMHGLHRRSLVKHVRLTMWVVVMKIGRRVDGAPVARFRGLHSPVVVTIV